MTHIITRRRFLVGTSALISFAATGVPALSKPRLPGLAFVIGNEDRGCEVVWAANAREALDWVGDCDDDCGRFTGGHACDECSYIDVDRDPYFDGFQEGGVPLHAYRRRGWEMTCVRCEEAGVLHGSWSASDRSIGDWEPVPTRDGGFEVVCHDCMTINEHLSAGSMKRDYALKYKYEFWGLPWAELGKKHLSAA